MNNRVVFVGGGPEEKKARTPHVQVRPRCDYADLVKELTIKMTFQTHLGLRHLGLTHRSTAVKLTGKGIGAKR